jgi:hypothetical protein
MRFDIKRVRNGFLLDAKYMHTDDYMPDQYVYQSIEDNEHEAFAQFLRLIADNYGPSDSRYDDKRIYIVVHPGDKNKKWTNEIFPAEKEEA